MSDETPDSARLEACLALLLGATTEEELARAREQAKRVMAMSDEDVRALGTPEAEATSGPARYDRKSDAGEPHKYGCLMAVLPARLREDITSWAENHIDPAHLGSEGLESRPHITLKYGFRDSGPGTVARLRAMLAGVRPFAVRLGGFSSFDGKPGEGDPLFLEVESPELRELNAKVSRAFPCKDAHPEYTPHVTVAYVRADSIDPYAGVEGLPFQDAGAVVGSLEWSGADGRREIIRLRANDQIQK
jgi:2'-5' RNA ligase